MIWGTETEAIDIKGSQEIFKGFCLPYLLEMVTLGLTIRENHQS